MKPLGVWLDELKDWDVPVLRCTIQELGKLAARAEIVTAGQIADVVLRDPLMTFKVLRLINNRSRRSLSNEITTVEHAVMMMGVVPFFNRYSDLNAIEDNLSAIEGALTGLMGVVSRAHHAAWQARDWAIIRTDMKSEEVYIGALLHDLGEIVLWSCAPDLAIRIQRQMRREGISHAQAEIAVLGFELRELQFALAEVWNLPEMMQAFMHNESAPRPRMMGVMLAASVARHAESGWYGTQLPADYEVIAGLLRLSFDETVSIIHHNAIASARHWERYGVPPAAAWLPMLPGEWPAEETDDVESEAQSSVSEADAGEICLMPQADALQHAMAEIYAHLDGSLNLHEMMSLVLKGMHEGIGLNRVVFALMSSDRSALKAKYVVGAEADSPLRQFTVDLTVPQLFSRLMEKMQGVWLNAGNRQALAPMIPEGVWAQIGQGEFFAMSVFVNGRPVGLFYADKMRGNCALNERGYLEFKQLCVSAAKGLAHLAKQ